MQTQENTSTEQQDKAKIWGELDRAEAQGTTPGAEAVTAQPVIPAAQEPAPQSKDAATTVTAPASDASTEADPYAGLPQIVRDEIVGLKSILNQTVSRLRNTEGHIGGLNSQLSELKTARQAAQDSGARAPSADAIRAAQGSDSAMAKLKAEYPEFGAAMDAALEERLGTVRQEIAQAKPVVQNQPNAITREDLNTFERTLAVEQAHPGWKTTVQTPAFAGWLQGQPREVQMLAASDSPQDATRLLDLHKQARETGSGKQNQRLDSAAAIPSGRGAPSIRTKPIEQMTKSEYWSYLDEQDRAASKQAA